MKSNLVISLFLSLLFLPKIIIWIPINLFEIFMIIYIFKAKILIMPNYIKLYFITCVLFLFSALLHGIINEVIVYKDILKILKFMILGITWQFIFSTNEFNQDASEKLMNIIIYFIMINSIFVLMNILIDGKTLGALTWEYSNLYRVVGFTGYGIGTQGLEHLGNTSVQFSVLIVILYYYSLLGFLYQDNIYMKVFQSASLLVAQVLTFSITGLLLTIFITAYFILNNMKRKRVILFIPICFIPIFLNLEWILKFGGSISKLMNYGILNNPSIQIRLDYLNQFIEGILSSPIRLFFGYGYGNLNLNANFGVDHFESFFITTLASTGIIGIASVLLFYVLGIISHRGDAKLAVVTRTALVIFMVANTFSGNVFFTDFLVPFVFLLSAVNYKTNSKHVQI
jgi:hypothetical protein